MAIRRIDDLGRVQLPKDYRKVLDIHEGDELVIELKDGYMSVKKEEKKIGEEGMERLTKETIGCFKYTLKDHKVKVGDFGEYDAFFDYSMAVKRLGEYEDTGLTPEQIQAQQAQLLETRLERNAQEANKNYYKRQLKESNQLTPEQIQAQQQEIDRLQQWVDDLQSGMYVNCVYCGHRYGMEKDTPVSMADVLKEHIEHCHKHPMSAFKQQIEALTADKDEQVGWIMQLEELAKDLYFAYINKDEDFPHSFETKAIEKYKALLGGAEDETNPV